MDPRYGQADPRFFFRIRHRKGHTPRRKSIFSPWLYCIVGSNVPYLHMIVSLYPSIAQLLMQPLSSYLLVRLRLSFYVPFIVTCWGATLACMSAAVDFRGLLVARFFVFIPSACFPRLSVLTNTSSTGDSRHPSWQHSSSWVRSGIGDRSKDSELLASESSFLYPTTAHSCTPVWYANNGWVNVFGSLIMFGLGHIKSSVLHSYQIVFMLLGLVTFSVGIIGYDSKKQPQGNA